MTQIVSMTTKDFEDLYISRAAYDEMRAQMTAEIERLTRERDVEWVQRLKETTVSAARDVEVERLTAERDALKARAERAEATVEAWRWRDPLKEEPPTEEWCQVVVEGNRFLEAQYSYPYWRDRRGGFLSQSEVRCYRRLPQPPSNEQKDGEE